MTNMQEYEVVSEIGKHDKFLEVKDTEIIRINKYHISSAVPETYNGLHPDGYIVNTPFQLVKFHMINGNTWTVFRLWDEYNQFGNFFDPATKKFSNEL